MDRCKYLEIINTIFFKNYKIKNKKPNTLILSIIYSFNLITKEDFNIWDICFSILKKHNPDSEVYRKFFYIMTVFYCFFTSYQNTYALPCLLDKKMINDQVISHLLFGEHLTQLTNFILVSEAMNIIYSNFNEDKEILDLIKYCHQELNWLNNDNILIKNFNNLTKDDITTDYNRMHYELFKFAISITYRIMDQKLDPASDTSIQQLYQISFPHNKVYGTT